MIPKLLLLLIMSSYVYSLGYIEINILSTVSGVMHCHLRVQKHFNASYNWKPIYPILVANESFLYKNYFHGPTLPVVSFQIKMMDEEELIDIMEEQMVNFALTREYNNFTIAMYSGNSVEFSVRNVCKEHFYGDACDKTCISTPDDHYTCDYNLGIVCNPGWSYKSFCTTPICSQKCNSRGTCIGPEDCKCATGYGGNQCDTCLTSPGCKFGKCKFRRGQIYPFTCDCLPGFMGENCDIPDICGTAKPCRRGVCVPRKNAIFGYKCICDRGFSGVRCDQFSNRFQCSIHKLCQNGGHCITRKNRSWCQCPSEFSGPRCQNPRTSALMKLPGVDYCAVTKCRIGYFCVMDENKPICVSNVNPGPLVTIRRNQSSVIYNFYYGVYNWKSQDLYSVSEKVLENAVDESQVAVYRVQKALERDGVPGELHAGEN